MNSSEQKRLLEMLKVLSDESRLNLLQRINEREYTVGELAEHAGLSEPTVSHHLTRLREAGLIMLRMDGNKRIYRINEGTLATLKELVSTIEQLPAAPAPKPEDTWIAELGWSEEDQQVLRTYTSGGQLTHLPAKQQKRLMVILRWLATLFKPDTLYTEKDVNAVLKSVYEADYVSLRRDLVDYGFLRRERGGVMYWLAPVHEEMPAKAE